MEKTNENNNHKTRRTTTAIIIPTKPATTTWTITRRITKMATRTIPLFKKKK